MNKKLLTLCVPVLGDKVLLGMKKRGFGAGRWNGFGGKVEEGETIDEAVVREIREEVGITDGRLSKVGILDFSFQENDKVLEVHVYRLENFTDTSIETEEMKPAWFSVDEIPFQQMWSDDIHWFPLLLKRALFKGAFLFDRPSDADYAAKIITQTLEEVSSL